MSARTDKLRDEDRAPERMRDLKEIIREETAPRIERNQLSNYALYGLVALIAIAIGGFLVSQRNHDQNQNRQRRGQSCTYFERQYRRDTGNLNRTYRYLLALPANQQRQAINVALLAGVPNQEQMIRDGRPPSYCAVKGVGLPAKEVPPEPQRPTGLEVPSNFRALPSLPGVP